MSKSVLSSKKVASIVASNGTTILLNIGQAADHAPKPVQNVRRYNKMSRSTSHKNRHLTNALTSTALLGTGIIGGVATIATNKKWHTHFVTRTDSLLSLSLRYNVSMSEIKRWNKLPTSNRKIASSKLEILTNPNNPNVCDSLQQMLPTIYWFGIYRSHLLFRQWKIL